MATSGYGSKFSKNINSPTHIQTATREEAYHHPNSGVRIRTAWSLPREPYSRLTKTAVVSRSSLVDCRARDSCVQRDIHTVQILSPGGRNRCHYNRSWGTSICRRVIGNPHLICRLRTVVPPVKAHCGSQSRQGPCAPVPWAPMLRQVVLSPWSVLLSLFVVWIFFRIAWKTLWPSPYHAVGLFLKLGSQCAFHPPLHRNLCWFVVFVRLDQSCRSNKQSRLDLDSSMPLQPSEIRHRMKEPSARSL